MGEKKKPPTVTAVRMTLIECGSPKTAFRTGECLLEPIASMNRIMIQGEADRIFGEILEDCQGAGRDFASAANTAFRKRASGEPRDGLEQRILALFDRIDTIEFLDQLSA